MTNLPANLQLILESVHSAISFDVLKDKAKDWSIQKFNSTRDSMSAEELNAVGIKHPTLFWSLGIYAFVFIFLVVVVIIYYIVKYLASRSSKMRKIIAYFRKKLFFNSWIRLMIQSNLKITHNSVFFLSLTGSFDTT